MKNNNKRKAVIPVRFTSTERDILKEKAASFNLSISSFVRMNSLNLKLPKTIPSINNDTYRILVGVANNLNQLVRAINSGKDCEVEAKQIRELKQIISKVGLNLRGNL